MIKNFKKIMPLSIKKTVRRMVDYYKYKTEYNKMLKKPLSKYENKRLIMIGTPNSGNLGDHAIAEAEEKLIADNFPDLQYIEISFFQYLYNENKIAEKIKKDDILLIHGGGFLGNLWLEAEYLVRNVIKKFPNNQIFIFPQTIFFSENDEMKKEMEQTKSIYDSHNNLTIFLREKQSYDFANDFFDTKLSIKLVPDVVTYLNKSEPMFERKQVLTVLRNDHERIDNNKVLNLALEYLNEKNGNIKSNDNVLSHMVDQRSRKSHLENQFNNFKESKIVVTDRLHGMIFALITGTPCLALNNLSGKVKGVYSWIKGCEYIQCIDSDINEIDLFSVIDRLLQISDEKLVYNPENLRRNFEPLISEIENALKSEK